jgi:hypothetical protein
MVAAGDAVPGSKCYVCGSRHIGITHVVLGTIIKFKMVAACDPVPGSKCYVCGSRHIGITRVVLGILYNLLWLGMCLARS